MATPIIYLLGDVALITMFVGLWQVFWMALGEHEGPIYRLSIGVALGFAGIVLFETAYVVNDGISLDLQPSLVGFATLLGGPVIGFMAGIVGILYELYAYDVLRHEVYLTSEILATCAALLVGSYYRRHVSFDVPTVFQNVPHYLVFGLAITLIILTRAVTLGTWAGVDDISAKIFAFGFLLFVGTSALALGFGELRRSNNISRQNQIYRSVVDSLPDSLTVKRPDGRYMLANPAAADMYDLNAPSELVGRTDAALMDGDLASQRKFIERQILIGGVPDVREEQLSINGQVARSFMVQRAPLFDGKGGLAGLISHSRDISDFRELEAALKDTRQLFAASLDHMSEGIALLDADHRLVTHNAKFLDMFPKTGHLRQPGTSLTEMIRLSQSVGEVVKATELNTVGINIKGTDKYFDHELLMFDERWLEVRHRVVPDGHILLLYQDVTETRKAKQNLIRLNAELAKQAAVDGLTGLKNRMDFDRSFQSEWQKCQGEASTLSLMMIDIDYFKKFNDTYGHLAGDTCLKDVARALQHSIRQDSDVLARYGGEEFIAIMPDTGVDNAGKLAEKLRQAVLDLKITHEKSPHGRVSVSIGIATLDENLKTNAPEELIAVADLALYEAKELGRNRVQAYHLDKAPKETQMGTGQMRVGRS